MRGGGGRGRGRGKQGRGIVLYALVRSAARKGTHIDETKVEVVGYIFLFYALVQYVKSSYCVDEMVRVLVSFLACSEGSR